MVTPDVAAVVVVLQNDMLTPLPSCSGFPSMRAMLMYSFVLRFLSMPVESLRVVTWRPTRTCRSLAATLGGPLGGDLEQPSGGDHTPVDTSIDR